MGSTTPNIGLTKPTPGDPADRNVWGDTLNANSDTIDGIFKSDGTGTGVGLKAAASQVWNAIAGTLKAAAARFLIVDASDNTKVVKFDVSGVSASTTRTLTVQDVNGTIALSADVTALAAAPIGVAIQKFTASGTYTPHAKLLYAIVECVGGGGGGGGTASSVAGNAAGAGGGGGGGYARSVLSAATIGVSKAVTIGAAGSAGAAGNNAGGNGGDTSLGTLVIGKGGTGGAGSSGGTSGIGGAGGVAGTGDITYPGMTGGTTEVVSGSTTGGVASNFGGNSHYGVGGAASSTSTTSTGKPGQGFGGGGAGGGVFNNNGTAAGGAGTAGLVIITEFYAP